jgi:CheY-like chemotaxis protein
MTTVLLVDDEPETLAAWEMCCEHDGYEVKAAGDGQAALAVLMGALHNRRGRYARSCRQAGQCRRQCIDPLNELMCGPASTIPVSLSTIHYLEHVK